MASTGPSSTRRGRSTNAQILTAIEGQGTTSSIVIVVKPESRPSQTRWRWKKKKKEIVTITPRLLRHCHSDSYSSNLYTLAHVESVHRSSISHLLTTLSFWINILSTPMRRLHWRDVQILIVRKNSYCIVQLEIPI